MKVIQGFSEREKERLLYITRIEAERQRITEQKDLERLQEIQELAEQERERAKQERELRLKAESKAQEAELKAQQSEVDKQAALQEVERLKALLEGQNTE